MTDFLAQITIRFFTGNRSGDLRFTDCTSKIVIEKLGITRGFSFDEHFRQFGSVAVVP